MTVGRYRILPGNLVDQVAVQSNALTAGHGEGVGHDRVGGGGDHRMREPGQLERLVARVGAGQSLVAADGHDVGLAVADCRPGGHGLVLDQDLEVGQPVLLDVDGGPAQGQIEGQGQGFAGGKHGFDQAPELIVIVQVAQVAAVDFALEQSGRSVVTEVGGVAVGSGESFQVSLLGHLEAVLVTVGHLDGVDQSLVVAHQGHFLAV